MPVINENDTVATAEIRFGDNDRLAARVAQMISADTLVLLSDIDGLYTADPRSDPDRAPHPRGRASSRPEIEAMAGEAPPGYSSGGMVTKLAAARIAMGAGCRMVIADGRRLHPLGGDRPRARAAAGSCPPAAPRTARKNWIAGALKPVGSLTVDDGALKALAARQEPAARRRRRGRGRASSAAMRCACSTATGREVGARPLGLFGGRCPAHHRAQER